MIELQSLLQHPVWQTMAVVCVVMLVERLWRWPDKYHPLVLLRLIAINLSRKVHPDLSRTPQQQRISGTLAVLVVVLPLQLMLIIFLHLAEYPWFFDGLMLLVALQFNPVLRQYKKVTNALAGNKKVLARELLAPLVLRETRQLSPMGIAKAAIESLLLRFSYQYWSVLFWYLLLGGPMALSYRLMYEFAQVWNPKLSHYRFFGQPASLLVILLSWLPTRMVAIAVAIAESLSGAYRASRNINYQLSGAIRQHTALLAMMGGALGIQLGGPAYYAGNKVRMAKVGGAREIRFADLPRVRHTLIKVTAIFITLLILLWATLYSLQVGGTW